MNVPSVFLTAEWRSLAMINYPVDPAVLSPLVPEGTELDFFQGRTFVSLVGFLFLNTRVFGIAIPGHRNFPEVNLRFYVRRNTPDGWRRGVVFIKEIVPRRAIAAVARWWYHENYVALPMRHQLESSPAIFSAAFDWHFGGDWNSLVVQASAEPSPIRPDSEEEFITEHYWGYNRRPDGRTTEYGVEHPRWRVRHGVESRVECAAEALYGRPFASVLAQPPSSAFIAEGSAITVRRGTLL